MNFEWDENKNQANIRKHGISFSEAKSVFNDFNAIFLEDNRFDYGEIRYIAIGQFESDFLNKSLIVMVVYTERREDLIRIISARKAGNEKSGFMNNKVSGNNKKDFSEMTKAQRHQALLEMSEEEIDYSDIAPLDDEFLMNAKQVENPLLREGKTVRIKSEVIKWFRSQAQSQNYERLINDVLESYMKEHQGK